MLKIDKYLEWLYVRFQQKVGRQTYKEIAKDIGVPRNTLLAFRQRRSATIPTLVKIEQWCTREKEV